MNERERTDAIGDRVVAMMHEATDLMRDNNVDNSPLTRIMYDPAFQNHWLGGMTGGLFPPLTAGQMGFIVALVLVLEADQRADGEAAIAEVMRMYEPEG